MIPCRAAIILLLLSGCVATRTSHPVTSELAAIAGADPSTIVDPTTEHAIGYVGLVAEVIVIAGVIFGVYKLARIFGH